MKNRKLLSLLLAVVMVFSLVVPAMAAEEAEEAVVTTTAVDEAAAEEDGLDLGDLTGKTVILHSNDVHGAVAGYAYIAALKTAYEEAGAEVILADAGDFSQGTPYVSLSKGATAITMMNAAGYDVVTLGNHEFDFGYAQLKANLAEATFKAICADVLEDGELILDPTYIYETASGVKVGFLGLETPETQTKVNPGLIQGIKFLANSTADPALNTAAQTQIDDLKADGADVIIGIFHLGVDDESAGDPEKGDSRRSTDIFAATTGLDFVLDGHSHTVMTEGENGEPIQSTGTKFAYVGVVVIDDATKTIEDNYLLSTEDLPVDEAVAAKAQEIIDAVDTEYGAVFAKSEVELTGTSNPGNRTQETNNGDLITDAIKWSVLNAGSIEVDDANVVAITNGGGIRAAINVGDVTMKDINTVLPFGNTVAVIYVTGAELLEALEASTFATPGAIGGYPQTAGIVWSINTAAKYDANEETYPDSTYYGPASIQRVTIDTINGVAFDEEATYAVITNNFCAAGGDTYYAFKRAYDAGTGFDTGIPLDEAVMNFITDELEGVISAEKYGETRGDLTIAFRPADLDKDAWYYDVAVEAIDKGLMIGTNKGFEAETALTKASVLQTLYRLEGEPVVEAEGAEWYVTAVAWAKSEGLVDDTFEEGVCSREEAMEILKAYTEAKELEFEGLFIGNENGDLMEAKDFTRAEYAQVLLRLEAKKAAATEETAA